jgi:hypothetical protein
MANLPDEWSLPRSSSRSHPLNPDITSYPEPRFRFLGLWAPRNQQGGEGTHPAPGSEVHPSTKNHCLLTTQGKAAGARVWKQVWVNLPLTKIHPLLDNIARSITMQNAANQNGSA